MNSLFIFLILQLQQKILILIKNKEQLKFGLILSDLGHNIDTGE